MQTVSDISVKPPVALTPYIRCFMLRTLDTMGETIAMPCFARNESFIPFCLDSRYAGFEQASGSGYSDSGEIHKASLALGLSTAHAGEVCHNGQYRIFYIQFTANGFYEVFGTPAHLLTNSYFDLEQVAGASARQLLQQLQEAGRPEAMAAFATQFLVYHLKHKREVRTGEAIRYIAESLRNESVEIPMHRLAAEVNMSLRSMERQFAAQIGITPKMYARIARFNRAMLLRLKHPQMTSTSIAHTCNYFDQMHMIKEFQLFAGRTPAWFQKHPPLLLEHFLAV